MKILMCHNLYRFRGGEERVKDLLVDLLRARGHDVIEYLADSREIDDYCALRRLGVGLRASYAPATVRAVRRLVHQSRPDVAHVHNVFPLLSPSLYVALHDLGVPVVQHIHNFRLLCPNGLFFVEGAVCQRCAGGNFAHAVIHRCLHGSLPMSAAYAASMALHWRLGTFPHKLGWLLAPNRFTADALIRRISAAGGDPARVVVLPHPIDTANLTPRQGQAFEPVVIYMGRLSAEKGLSTLVQAMAQVPELELHLIGDGPERAALEAQVAALRLGNVRFLGYVAGEARFARLREAMCLAMPSLMHEQFGMAIAEAFALGVTVVASGMGALPELVQHEENGLLFTAGRVDELAACLKRLAGDPALVLRLGEAARRTVEQNHNPDAYYARLMDVYRRAVVERSESRLQSPD